MATLSETVDLTDGTGFIDVRGSGFDSMLLVDGRPIALNWCDCEGSVAQYLVRAGRTDCEQELQALRHTLEGHLLPDVPLQTQISPFLELLAPGHYELSYIEACPDCHFVVFDTSWDFATDHDQFYPFGTDLVLTQASDSLNPDRIEHFVRRIQAGQRPIALTLTVPQSWCEFVIDGHHKLQAYKAAMVGPTLISVCRLDAPKLNPDSFAAHLGASHPKSRDYRRVKTDHDPGA